MLAGLRRGLAGETPEYSYHKCVLNFLKGVSYGDNAAAKRHIDAVEKHCAAMYGVKLD